MSNQEFIIKTGAQDIKLQTGILAPQANGAVLATMGQTVVLAAVTIGPQDETKDYFPLSVEFSDKLYAGGFIKSSRWLKREGGLDDNSILSGRLIDRAIRPLFPPGFNYEVQVVVTVLSNDKQSDVIIPAFQAVSAALAISDIPFNGPVSACRVGLLDKKLILNPSLEQLSSSRLDLLVCASLAGVNMIEAGASIVDNDTMLSAITLAKIAGDKINEQIAQMAKKLGRPKMEFIPALPDAKLIDQVEDLIKKDIVKFLKSGADDGKHMAAEAEIIKKVLEHYQPQIEAEEIKPNYLVEAVASVIKKYLRANVLKGIRFDSRKTDQVRTLKSQIGVLPRTHGSAFFQRGLTQALTITTLSALTDCQYLQDSVGETTKRYIHFYSAPPFSTGQTGRFGRPGRREVGHGALAEKALLPVIPDAQTFPYTILLNSEVLSQNGSSSMASTCGSTLSLLSAGVPIKAKVAGVSIGLISDPKAKKYQLLTDIAGIEDHNGDMDFKITGTRKGVTAIQLDIKTDGLSLSLIKDIFAASTRARLQILDHMDQLITQPAKISPYAPKIKLVKIPQEKIGDIIGSGGRTIRELMEKYSVQIDVDDTGAVSISSLDDSKLDAAAFHITSMVRQITVGEEFDGTVTRVENYGAFVEFLPGREALVHVSELSQGFLENINSVIKIGQAIHVKVIGFNENHQIKLSAPQFKAQHSASAAPRASQPSHPSRPPGRSGPPRSPALPFLPPPGRPQQFASFHPHLKPRRPSRNRVSR